jgi:transposase
MKGTSPSRGSGEVSANGNKCHDGISIISSTPRKGKSMNIITVGIDLAKNVFAVHGVDDNGKPVLVKPKVARADLLPLIANLPQCLIGMEACSGSTATPSS